MLFVLCTTLAAILLRRGRSSLRPLALLLPLVALATHSLQIDVAPGGGCRCDSSPADR